MSALVYNNNEVINLGISYNKLFVLMEQKNIKKYHLRQQGIHAAVMDKLVKSKNVDISTIEKLCKLLDCQPGDILEYVPDEENAEESTED